MTKNDKERQKELAISLMRELNIYKPYINDFNKSNIVYFYDSYAGFWLSQKPEIKKMVKKFEEENNCLVYAVTHTTNFDCGEMWDFLFVPSDLTQDMLVHKMTLEEFDSLQEIYKSMGCPMVKTFNPHRVFVYTYNETYEDCSEYGYIIVDSIGGGIKRVI